MYNIPVFAKRDLPIKRAMIAWLETQFDSRTDPAEPLDFKIGDLEDGVKHIMKNPKLSTASLRTHVNNLKTDKFIAIIATPNIPGKDQEQTSGSNNLAKARNKHARIGAKEMARLIAMRTSWDNRSIKTAPQTMPAAPSPKTSRDSR